MFKTEKKLETKDETTRAPDPRPDAGYASDRFRQNVGEKTLAQVTPPTLTERVGEHLDNAEVKDLLQAVMDTFRRTDNGLHTQLWNRVEVAIKAAEGKVKGVSHRRFDPTRRPEDQAPPTQEEIQAPTGVPASGVPVVTGELPQPNP